MVRKYSSLPVNAAGLWTMSVLASSRSRGRLDPDVRAETNTKRRLVTSLVFVLGLPWAWEHIPAPSLEEGEGQLWSVALYMLTVAIDCFNSLQVCNAAHKFPESDAITVGRFLMYF